MFTGWTDVASESIRLPPGARRQNTLCIAETFPVKTTGKEMLRQVRVQGKLRIIAEYGIPTWRIIDKPLGKGRRAYVRTVDKSNRWTFGEVVLGDSHRVSDRHLDIRVSFSSSDSSW